MPYSYPNNVPTYASKKSAAVKKVAVEVFNTTFNKTNSETKARIASLAAMKNAEDAIAKKKKTEISKSNSICDQNEELMQVTYVVLQPGVDGHGDYFSKEEIRKAKESFNKALLGSNLSNLFHVMKTKAFDIIESYIAPCDMSLSGNDVQDGSWLCTLQINKGFEPIWEGIKNGDFVGVSIGAMAVVEEVKDDQSSSDETPKS